MATKDRHNFVVLQGDVHGDDESVRAILEGWGLEENAIYRLLTEGRYGDAPPAGLGNARPDETVPLLRGGTPARGHTSH